MRPIHLILLAFWMTAPCFAISPMYKAPWPDFADHQHSGACTALVASATDRSTISSWPQEQLDLLYSCLPAGPIPNGFMDGTVVFAEGGNFSSLLKYTQTLGLNIDKAGIKIFAEALWKGKEFYRDSGALLNRIGPSAQLLLGVNIAGQMRFPAKVFCGQSLLDARRESIVIDYAKTETVKINEKTPYLDTIDWIAGGQTSTGKRGLMVRDEIRMIKPGFYLGRAYLERIFVLNFILTGSAADGQDKCWKGYTKI